ncbi:Hypothetical predicted protein [Cloeon dipterum]|uniref:Uncharacterized protein n=1 Tax=Cloeon dipterum TaxID=197152 RepID=A0A8S1CP85_9INSE|nr:Hypothetical predicted protein [Cloeon dipterum]
MRRWAPLFGFFVLCTAIQGKAVDEKWQKLGEKYRMDCIAELEIPSDDVITPNDTLAKTKLEEFTPKQRCLMKCVAEKFIGVNFDDLDEFYKKSFELLEEFSDSVPKKKLDTYKEAIEKCKGTRGANNCDSVVLIHLCEKAIISKYDFSSDED